MASSRKPSTYTTEEDSSSDFDFTQMEDADDYSDDDVVLDDDDDDDDEEKLEDGDSDDDDEEEGVEDGGSDDDDDDGEEEEDDDDDMDDGEEGSESEGGDDTRKVAEMEELEKQYRDLRDQEIDILKSLKQNKDELLKGQAVKNQKALWDKNLEFRVLLQKPFASSNRLPQGPVRSSFCDADEAVCEAYTDLISSSEKTLESLLELEEAILENNPSISQPSDVKHFEEPKNLGVEGDDEWLQICQVQRRIAPFRNKSIDRWQRKTQVTTGAAAIKGKLTAFNQDISQQVAAYMRDPSRMLKQMLQRRSVVGVFGAVPEHMGNPTGEDAHIDGDPELLDDSEFYQQLLKEFFETIDPTSAETAFYSLKRLRPKKRKNVDRRASKSRKIRYHVHEKIVNFMAPQPMNLPPMAPKLFQNLFGLKTKKW